MLSKLIVPFAAFVSNRAVVLEVDRGFYTEIARSAVPAKELTVWHSL